MNFNQMHISRVKGPRISGEELRDIMLGPPYMMPTPWHVKMKRWFGRNYRRYIKGYK